MSDRCPCCGGPLPGFDLKWFPQADTLFTGKSVIRFTPSEARVFDALWDVREKGDGLTYEKIKTIIYADDYDGGAESNTIQQFILRIRNKLKGSPLTILCRRGECRYRLAWTEIAGRKAAA